MGRVRGSVGLVQAAGRVYRLDGAPLRFNQADTRIPSGAVASLSSSRGSCGSD
jgi:hypothetical protein